MLQRIEDDLTAAYQEVNDIDEILSSHETIINDVVFKNLELAIDELESRIESYEFINTSQLGFDNAIFNTFRSTQNNRTGNNRSVIFTDPKTGSSNNGESEALIDFIGEKLLLRSYLSKSINIQNIRQIFDSEAKASELDVEFENSSLLNIIDSRRGTFWVQSILLSKDQNSTGVITKLELNLGSFQTINTLELEPLLLYPVDLISIEYFDSNNQVNSILSTSIEIRSTNKLLFNAVSTDRLLLKFRNKNYSYIDFIQRPGTIIPRIKRREDLDSVAETISDSLDEVISSPRLKDALPISTELGTEKAFIEYLIGFDNIKVGLNKFSEVGIFVSAGTKLTNLGQLALRTTEKRPFGAVNSIDVEYTTDTYPSALDTFFHGSLEYFCIKKDYSEDNKLINTLIFPVLPIQATQIRHERLYLTEKSGASVVTNDVGYLHHYTIDSLSDIHVYRNGIEIDSADLNPGETDGWVKYVSSYQPTPNQSTPMRFAIQIQQPSTNHIYTVSYKPAVSTADYLSPSNLGSYEALQGIKYVDLTGNLDAWLGPNNTIRFKSSKNGTKISYSIVSLGVVLRRNSANLNLTPVLEDYLLATSSSDEGKF